MILDFKVFTLNCWGLAIVSKNRKNRIKAIAKFLSNSQYDVVCLQELWVDRDYNLIKDEVAEVLPYSHYFYSGVTGSGICIFSKYVIEEVFFHQWPLNGYIHKLHHGDWFGGKGVGLCKLTVNNLSVNIYSAHLHAEYNRKSDEYEAHRILQAYDTAQFILLTSQGADLVVLAGDLNTLPGDLAYKLLTSIPGLVDAFDSADVPRDHEATCESLRNSYTPSSLVKRKTQGQRIDYIMFHPGSKFQVEMKKYKLPLPDRVPLHSFSYSDHEGVEATFEISKQAILTSSRNENDVKNILDECDIILNQALNNLVTHKRIYIIFSILLMCSLISTVIIDAPAGFVVVYNIFRVVIGILLVFSILMGFIWNKIEKHGVLAGKLAIEKSLKRPTEL